MIPETDISNYPGHVTRNTITYISVSQPKIFLLPHLHSFTNNTPGYHEYFNSLMVTDKNCKHFVEFDRIKTTVTTHKIIEIKILEIDFE